MSSVFRCCRGILLLGLMFCPVLFADEFSGLQGEFFAAERAIHVDNDPDAYGQIVADLRELHEAGDPEATLYLGLALLIERAPGYEPDEGVSLVRQSAEAGFPRAQVQLASLYEYGDRQYDFPQDDDQALIWWKRAAENGDRIAIRRLEAVYTEGHLEVEPDASRAAYWRNRDDCDD